MSTAVETIGYINSVPGTAGTATMPSGGWQQLNEIKKDGRLAEALARAQGKFKAVPKTKTAKMGSFSYKYADLGDILEMIRPLLSAEGIFLSQPILERGGKRFVVTRLYLGSEVLEDSGIEIPASVTKQDFGTYASYYRRYGLSSFLGIATEDDTDGPPQEGRQESVSTSGQVPFDSSRTAAGQAAKKSSAGRTAKGNTVVPPNPPAQTTAPIATDDDLPSNIGPKPTTTEMGAIKERLNGYGADREALKKYILAKTGRENAGQLTLAEWNETLAALDKAKAAGSLADLVK